MIAVETGTGPCCIRTPDGGKAWNLFGWIGEQPGPGGYAIMPSTLRLSENALLSIIRLRGVKEGTRQSWIEGYLSADNGRNWYRLAEPTINNHGNPPHMIRLRDGRIVLTYGYRAAPYGIRAVISSDQGRTWGGEIVLRDDGGEWDLGYPRTVQRPDGKCVTAYYFNDGKRKERYIARTIRASHKPARQADIFHSCGQIPAGARLCFRGWAWIATEKPNPMIVGEPTAKRKNHWTTTMFRMIMRSDIDLLAVLGILAAVKTCAAEPRPIPADSARQWALAAELGVGDFQSRFLTFCDLAAAELNKEITRFADRDNADPAIHHMPFFEDAHAFRALAVAYDMTGEKKYLDACRRWSDRIIEYQSRMIPTGAYYMNHSRAPGENRGQWNVADSGSIAIGVLATAIRCKDPAEKAKYLESVKAFAKLVMENYIGPEGGISNGLWPTYDGQWWCSTATFGTMAFVLYEETGEEKYLKVANGALDWMTQQDFREVKPITFQQRPSGIIFYCFDLYATGLKCLKPGAPQYQRAILQIDLALDWMAKNQKTRGADVPDYLVRNVDMAGLPSLMYAFARQLPQYRDLVGPADRELRYIGDLLLGDGTPNVSRLMVWEVMTWGMMSYAERLYPGAMQHSTKQIRNTPAPKLPAVSN
jgi:rhamnogalacturonyl hydrolase YesR